MFSQRPKCICPNNMDNVLLFAKHKRAFCYTGLNYTIKFDMILYSGKQFHSITFE